MNFTRYFILLSYNGTGFCGWQYQPGVPTIQETLNEKMTMLLREKIEVVGCGRTDSGVHARKFYAHFDSSIEGLETDEKVIFRLNKILPPGIAVQQIFKMHLPNAHARFAAVSRSYEYHITNIKNPFGTQQSWEHHDILDFSKMNEGARILLDYDDFVAFSKTGGDNKTTFCKVTVSEWRKENNRLVYSISANRFLRNMVRAIVGTLVEVGKGKINPEEVHRVIQSKQRSQAGQSVPAQGLYLTDVKYPEDYNLI